MKGKAKHNCHCVWKMQYNQIALPCFFGRSVDHFIFFLTRPAFCWPIVCKCFDNQQQIFHFRDSVLPTGLFYNYTFTQLHTQLHMLSIMCINYVLWFQKKFGHKENGRFQVCFVCCFYKMRTGIEQMFPFYNSYDTKHSAYSIFK